MSKKPNIIVIMTDQQRADVSAREGFPLDTTPFLDEMARSGVWFNRAYTTAPLCSPARISFLTGRYPNAHSVRENRGQRHVRYERDLFDVMKEQGYASALIGKNHTYLKPEESLDFYSPYNHHGGESQDEQTKRFDSWLGSLKLTSREATPFPLECQCPYRAVDDALGWMRQQTERPFFLWLSIPEPHTPFQAPEPYYSMFPPESLPPVGAGIEALESKSVKWNVIKTLDERFIPNHAELVPQIRSNYFGMLRLIDDQLRRMVDTMRSEGVLDNTLIVFLSDHGDFVGEYGLSRKGPEVPDILMRIPMFVCGPGVTASEAPHEAHVSIADIMPTLCEAVGAPMPRGVQGRSLWPMLTGQPYPEAEFASVYGEQGFGGLSYSLDEIDYDYFGAGQGGYDPLNTYTQCGSIRTVRKGDWKLDLDSEGSGQLYDLRSDPLETDNLYGRQTYRDKEHELLQELALWMIRLQDPLPYPVGKYRMKVDPRNYWTQPAE
jgi:arylsulfatase A-like enzyme